MSDSLRPREPQHARPPCPSPTPRVNPTHVHRVGDAIQPSHPLSSTSPALNLSQHQDLTSVVKDIIFPYIVATRVIILWGNPWGVSGKGLLKEFSFRGWSCVLDSEEELGSRDQFWVSGYEEARKIQTLSILIICT